MEDTIWHYGCGIQSEEHLFSPVGTDRLPNGDTLIADHLGQRVLRVNQEGQVVWSYGKFLEYGSDYLKAPCCSKFMSNGNILVSEYDANIDEGRVIPPNGRVLEINSLGEIVRFIETQSICEEASELPGGRLLITRGHSNDFADGFYITDWNGEIHWKLTEIDIGDGKGTVPCMDPTRAKWLGSNLILCTDRLRHRVFIVNIIGNIVIWSWGKSGVPGKSPNMLHLPDGSILLHNGCVLISDLENRRFVEIRVRSLFVKEPWRIGKQTTIKVIPFEAFDLLFPVNLLETRKGILVSDEAGATVQEFSWEYFHKKERIFIRKGV